jgi:CRP/FNR family transcriptional regulator, cyclic AMP receptor protein
VKRAAARLFGEIPLFAGLEDDGLESIARIFQPVSFPATAHLVRQGQPADGAYIIESGAADVITALPGGGEMTIAALGPGSVLGEMALLESGIRSATVIARAPVAGYFIERDGFRMLLLQRNRAAFTLQNRIALMLCRRLRELNAKVVASDSIDKTAPPVQVQARQHIGPARGSGSFDWRAFLPVLPLFRRYSAADLDAFAATVGVMELARAQLLFRQGDDSGACYVVVRGAIEITGARNGQRHRIGILGPGRLCGILAAIEAQPHSMSAAARESALLLEIGKATFGRLFEGDDRMAARFQEVINRELLQALARTNNHLTRLVSQARIRGGRQENKHAEDLQCALGGQDCRSANA